MDMFAADLNTADPSPNDAADPLPSIFMDRLLDALSNTVSTNHDEGPLTKIARWRAARMLFESMHPRTPIEAVLAARAVAALHAAMDMFARAAVPGTSDDKALRLRGNALAAARSFDAALRMLERRQVHPVPQHQDVSVGPPATARASQPHTFEVVAAVPRQSVEPPATDSSPQPPMLEPTTLGPSKPGFARDRVPLSAARNYQSRDKFGLAIPPGHPEWPTDAPQRATACQPPDPALEAAAIGGKAPLSSSVGCSALLAVAWLLARRASQPPTEPGASVIPGGRSKTL